MAFCQKANPITNSKYMSIPSGHESGEDGGQLLVRNHALEELFMTEDEMHELDINIHRFDWILGQLNSYKQNKDKSKVQTLVRKLNNFKILPAIYGKKVLVVKEFLEEKFNQICPMIISRVSQQLDRMRVVKEQLREQSWRARIANNYSKALDVKSNILRIQNKNNFSQKNIQQKMKEEKQISLY